MDKYYHFTNLATNLDARDQSNHSIHDVNKQLTIIADKNHTEYYCIFLEYKPTSIINISSNNTTIKLLNNEDPADRGEKTTTTMK